MKYTLRYALLLIGLLFSPGFIYGQMPTYSPPRMAAPMPRFTYYYNNSNINSPIVKGMYQLDDGAWKEGLLYLDTHKKLKVLSNERKDTLVYQAKQVNAFVVKTDTFGVIRRLNTGSAPLETVFAQRLYSYGQYTAFKLPHHLVKNGEAAVINISGGVFDLVLQPVTGDAVVVPTGRSAFTQTMLQLVGSSSELSAQITKGKLGRQHMRQILQAYARWQQANPQSATN